MQRPAWKLAALILSFAAQAAADGGRVHVVRSGQTLSGIAQRHGVSVAALCRANGIAPTRPIHPKQKLVIPEPRAAEGGSGRKAANEPAAPRPRTRKAVAKKSTARRRSEYEPSRPPSEYARAEHRLGYVKVQSTVGAWEGYVVVADGKVSTAAKRALSKVLASWRTGAQTDIDERLILLLTRVSDHFGGRPIRVVSGYRPYRPTQATRHSRHNTGHAVDFRIPGIPNETLRDFCRTLKNVGVGYYPNSTFVHLDVREQPARWTDLSGPGEHPRYARSKRGKAAAPTAARGPAQSRDASPVSSPPEPASQPESNMTHSGSEPSPAESLPEQHTEEAP